MFSKATRNIYVHYMYLHKASLIKRWTILTRQHSFAFSPAMKASTEFAAQLLNISICNILQLALKYIRGIDPAGGQLFIWIKVNTHLLMPYGIEKLCLFPSE